MKQNKKIVVKEKRTIVVYDDVAQEVRIKKSPNDAEQVKAHYVQSSTSQKSVSYRIGLEIKERVDELSDKYNVHKSDLVRFLLNRGMDQLEAGELELIDDNEVRPRKLKMR